MVTRYKNDFYHRFLYSQLDLLLTITRQLEQLYKKYIPGEKLDVRTLYYGVKPPEHVLGHDEIVTIREDKGFSESDFIIGLFGRLEDGKGQHLLIKALSIARQKDREVKALIVGHEMENGYRQVLIDLAESLGVRDSIVFTAAPDDDYRSDGKAQLGQLRDHQDVDVRGAIPHAPLDPHPQRCEEIDRCNQPCG